MFMVNSVRLCDNLIYYTIIHRFCFLSNNQLEVLQKYEKFYKNFTKDNFKHTSNLLFSIYKMEGILYLKIKISPKKHINNKLSKLLVSSCAILLHICVRHYVQFCILRHDWLYWVICCALFLTRFSLFFPNVMLFCSRPRRRLTD